MGAITDKQQPRFLTIPGEIRNCIYEMAVEDAKACQESDPDLHEIEEDHWDSAEFYHRKDMLPRLISPTRKRYSRYQHLATPDQLESWSDLRRPYLGLSQACSKIRQEFLPMYSEICVGVDLQDLNEYMRVFVVQRGGGVINYCGKIDISVEGDDGCDIRDALILINESPNARARFSSREMDEDIDLGTDGCDIELEYVLLDSAFQYSKFWDFILNKTTSVTLGIECTNAFSDMDRTLKGTYYAWGMEICVKAEFAEDWMHQLFGRGVRQWKIRA